MVDQILADLDQLYSSCSQEIAATETQVQLDQLRPKFFGKKSLLSSAMKSLSGANPEEKALAGKKVNEIRTKIDQLPHYLVEAKFEPGNYNKILLSPTLQATFSNINQAHKGRKPYYYEFFEDYEKTENYLFNNWLTEDGGRLYNKRNLGLVKFIPHEEISLKDGFIFLSMFQIKQLIRESSIVNPHLARLIFL